MWPRKLVLNSSRNTVQFMLIHTMLNLFFLVASNKNMDTLKMIRRIRCKKKKILSCERNLGQAELHQGLRNQRSQ
jgi:hypothetical protein